MGFAMVFGSCGGCGTPLSFNPLSVPSVRDAKGVKQPLCRACVAKWQASHPEQTFTVAADAYSPIEEERLVFSDGCPVCNGTMVHNVCISGCERR